MWSSSNGSVATVSNSGLVTAHKSGVANSPSGFREAVGSTLVLVDIPASLKIVSDVTNLSVGQTTQLSAVVLDRKGRVLSGASVTWSSDYDPVASVDDTGKVTAVSAGYTIITGEIG